MSDLLVLKVLSKTLHLFFNPSTPSQVKKKKKHFRNEESKFQ